MKQEFDKVKALNALLYVANRIGRKDFHKIFKILYFADRQHFANWGRPITGDTYIAMDAGPVPSRIYDMLKIVRGDSYASDIEGLEKFFKVEQWMYVNPLQDADLSKLSKTERGELDDAINRYGSMPYDEIKEISHDVAWLSTARDFAMKWEDIAREAGLDAEEIDYLRECKQLQASLSGIPMAGKNLKGAAAGLKQAAIMPGAVFIGPWEEIDHDKFIVIAGVAQDKVLACTVLINSRINPYIMRRQKMLDCQVYVKSKEYDFLSHDSFVNCAQPMIGNTTHFEGDEYKYCGLLKEQDLTLIKQSIVKSGLLTEEEIAKFGFGIHLDGTNQTLKVGHANQSGVTLSGASKVLTNQICDANGKNCKNVSQLSTGTNPTTPTTYTAGTGIKIEDYKISSTVTDTNTHNTAYIYAGKSNDSSNAATTNGSTYLILKDGNSVSNRVKITGTNGVSVSSDSNGTITISGTTSSTANKPLTIQGNGTAVTQFDGSSAKTLNIVAGSNITITTGNNQIKISANNGAGYSLRKIGTATNAGMQRKDVLMPKDLTKEMYIAGDIRHDGGIKIQALGTHEAYHKNSVMIHPVGVSIGDLANKTAGLGVHGPISVGKYMLSEEEISALRTGQCASTNRNTISIYASGNSVGAGEHFEIIGTTRILIGVKDGGYMYFDTDSQSNKIGINKQNPQATLDIDGSIRIGNCGNGKTCTKDNVGEIRYYEKSNKGYFVGCRRKSNGNANTNFERVILSDGTETTGSVANDCTTPVVPYDPSSYQDQGVLAQEQPACK